MKRRALGFLACPSCRGGLSLEAFHSAGHEDPEVLEGLLACSGCGRRFPVIGGIPRLLPDAMMGDVARRNPDFFRRHGLPIPPFPSGAEARFKRRTSSSFGFQWNAFPGMIEEFRDNFLRYIEPIRPSFFEGKLVLDAGCGFGRHTYYAAEFGAEVVGFDLSDAVESAYRNTRHFPNVHIVQADIYNPPFQGKFDFIFSIGVLHHLPRPREGFLSLSRIMKPGSSIFIWLYGKGGKPFRMMIVEGVLRKATTRMPHRMLYCFCYLPAAAYHSFNGAYRLFNALGLKGIADRMPFRNYARFPFMVKHADSFDLLGTPVNNYYSREDVEEWLRDARLRDTWVTQMGGWSWRAFGKR
jgi:SAM-dependent methyltransferase